MCIYIYIQIHMYIRDLPRCPQARRASRTPMARSPRSRRFGFDSFKVQGLGFSAQAVAWSQSGRLFELSQCGLLMFLAKAEGAG